MNPAPDSAPTADASSRKLRIYLLPNLLTAGNLFCGFLALTKIVEAELGAPDFDAVIRTAIFFIILACVFDLLDGRVARLGGYESPFGREFDSLADLISFGAAPAFLVHRVVLRDVFAVHPEIGWFIASIYLICGALRLARFNCLAVQPDPSAGKEFVGFPIPAAAGLVASITLFLLAYEEKGFAQSPWRYGLPVILSSSPS
jgi:CDP-diacylglycerol--serine O-phosphatidyltransferase